MALEFNPEQEEGEDEQLEVDDAESEPQQQPKEEGGFFITENLKQQED